MRLTDIKSQLGIGELSEKQIHHVLKNLIEPDKTKQEIRLPGNIGIADILRDLSDDNKEAIEIQSKGIYRLNQKLDFYLQKGYKTTVVYPVVTKKVLNWVDPVSEQVVESRKFQTGKNVHAIQNELYGIQPYVGKVNFQIYLLETDEYKYLDGYGQSNKKHATKIDKIPTNVIAVESFDKIEDYLKLVPECYRLDKISFTSNDYAKTCKTQVDLARTELLVLHRLGLVARVGKVGRKYLYRVV